MATKKKKVITKGQIRKKSEQLLKKGKILYKKTIKPAGIKAGGKLARHYKRYVRPTTKIVRGVGRFARGATKLALRFPGTGLAATGLYYGAKAIAKKGEKIAPRTAFRQYDKKGRWML
jgi:hypothetical protein